MWPEQSGDKEIEGVSFHTQKLVPVRFVSRLLYGGPIARSHELFAKVLMSISRCGCDRGVKNVVCPRTLRWWTRLTEQPPAVVENCTTKANPTHSKLFERARRAAKVERKLLEATAAGATPGG